jgi:signal recognition particle receptor subunit beta
MVFFNYATMQMAAKIVYYGAGLCGKTTNLHFIYAKTSPQSRGEMVSLETETDRTLFFDLLPIDVGVIGGFKTRLQLYTIPGQVFYNTTRKLVLKGVDGLVFVADSQSPMLQANVESLKNLRENLTEIGLNLDDIPMVIQFNKRDLPNIATVDSLREMLDPQAKYEHVESSAVSGEGVFETLKLISKLTLRMLRRRMMGEESKQAARKPVFQIHDESTARPQQPTAPAPSVKPPPPAASPPKGSSSQRKVQQEQELALAGVPRGMAASAPSDSRTVTAAVESSMEPEIEFSQIETPPPHTPKPGAAPSPAPKDPAKHVRLRSTIDIMAELEALRKKATQSPAKGKQGGTERQPDANSQGQRSLAFAADGSTAHRARAVRLTVTFEDEHQMPIQKQEQVVELEEADAKGLNLDVRIDLKSGRTR